MKPPRIKFIWGGARAIRGRWFLGLCGLYDRGGQSEGGLAISVRGLLGWSSGAIAAACMGTLVFPGRQPTPSEAVAHSRASEPGRDGMATPTAIPEMLASEDQFFAHLDALLQREDWDAASDWLLSARRSRMPIEWLPRRDADLRFVQVRIAHERDSTTEMLAAARAYMDGSRQRAERMLEVARGIYPVNKTRALELAAEVRRRSPHYPPAERLWAEWRVAVRKEASSETRDR